MNAQEKWKAYFREMKKQHRQSSRRRFRRYMKGERNRAALERIIARLKRENAALQEQVWNLEAQEHNRDDGNEWEKEYYLRGMHR